MNIFSFIFVLYQDIQNDPSSLYHVLRHMIATRRKHQSFGSGQLLWVESGLPEVSCWIRYYLMDVMLVVSNLSGNEKAINIKVPRYVLWVSLSATSWGCYISRSIRNGSFKR